MSSAELRERVTRSLLREIDEVQHPSVTMLDRVEATLETQEDVADYVEVLVRKVEASRFPSITMLDRIDGLLEQLERAEQRDRRDANGRED